MKTKFFAIAMFAISMVATVSAQELTFGAKAGINLATISCSEDEGWAMKPGFHIGATADYSLNEQSAISAELLFSQQGAQSSVEESGAEAKLKINLNYINIPIMYNYEVINNLHVKAGIQPGVFVSGKAKCTLTYDGESETETEDVDGEDMNTFDIAIPIGVSYDITENISVDARYNIGVSNMQKNSNDYSQKNNVLAVSVAYRF